MDLMNLSARDLSHKCLEAFQLCLTFRSADPELSNQQTFHDERFEYRLADLNLWIDGIGALAPSKASLDSRLRERQIDLSLVKGNLVMLFQSLEDCLNLLTTNQAPEDALQDIDSALESLVSLSLAIRKTGRRSRLHKADRLFKPEEHAELRKHLEAIIVLRPGPGPCDGSKFQKTMSSLTALQKHLVTANLKRRNRFIQAHLHSLGLKKRSVGFELLPQAMQQATAPAVSPEGKTRVALSPISTHTFYQLSEPLPAPMSVTSASIPESKLEYKEPVSKRTESTPMTVITQITASARYPRPRISDNEQKVVQCPCCCQTLPVSEAKSNNRWSRSLLEQHFRQDHPPVWVCPLCDKEPVYSNMTEMMDHLHSNHAQAIGGDISTIISLSAQTRMGIESCPLCGVKGDTDSPDLIDHVLEHVHDFSLRSLPWPKSSEVDLGGEVGSFNSESDETFSVIQWLEEYEHDTEEIDPTLELSVCDYQRLAMITEQIESQKQDRVGLDIGFADEHGDETAEAETDISQLTQDTLDPVDEIEEDRDVVYCHECSAEWYRDENGGQTLKCPKCQSELVEIVEPENDPRDLTQRSSASISPEPNPPSSDPRTVGEDGGHNRDEIVSKPSPHKPVSRFQRFADRLFTRNKRDHIQAEDKKKVAGIFSQFPALSQAAYSILVKLCQERLELFIKVKSAFPDFVTDIQRENISLNDHSVSDLDSFLQVMISSYMNPLKPLPSKDLTKPISNYFIKSSHRTLVHKPLSDSQTCSDSIQKALHAGYRSIDFDVWDGDDSSTADTVDRDLESIFRPSPARPGPTTKAFTRLFGPAREARAITPEDPKVTLSRADRSRAEPIVTDGLTLTVLFGFREACQVIRKSAFINTNLPVIVNLSVYASPGQQEIMVRIMKEEWNDCLVDRPLEGCDPRFRLPKLRDLLGRILVRLSAAAGPVLPRSKESGRDQLSEGSHSQEHVPIIQPLAELAVYMRNEPFEGFNTPWMKSPTHVFSLPEHHLQDLISVSHTNLFRHNQNHFFCVTPDSASVYPSNLDPLQFWKHGVQMATISRHRVDEGMMLNEGMFTDESGWVVKPDHYFFTDTGVLGGLLVHSRLIELSIFVFQGQAFDLITKDGAKQRTRDLSQFTNATIHISGESQHQLFVEDDSARDEETGALGYKLQFVPTWASTNIIPELSILRITFEDYVFDEGLIAWTSLRLDRLNQGYRLVPLYNNEGGLLSEEKMLIKFNVKLQK
ncbi:hypothetical protein FOIG_15349 [Fusarium odoratissimum NRRL 54006]|uniref:Phosphoinositide phospholipase C n=2 Tax=Fusarium oxysporum f. sp. cubense (strain race 4) TaxID=2502994 RepID=X0IRH8_FUSO5|nr:uncharacterized protein FOIG_15349 [Fusarium odoratissimum NRRL 54006]EXL91447.1 hypothetical protein FOIG_15349 [Fusarium odoratissimum NRRL 54006]